MTTPGQRRKRIGWGLFLAFAGAVIGLVLGWLVAIQYAGERDAAARNAQEQKVTADSALNYMRSACSAGDPMACDYVSKLTDLPDAPELSGKSGPPGPVGPAGPAGRDGRDGADGRDGRNGAPGPEGADGLAGSSGEPGPAGPAGPTGPAGADGKDGTNGVDGKDGRGIADLQCGADGRWTVTYTDGTTSDAGICRVDPGNSGENR